MIRVLEERDFPVGEIRYLASSRSVGKVLKWKGEDVSVQELTKDAFGGVDIALFSAGGGRSKEFAPAAVDAGAVVVDNSSAFRMDSDIPLVVPEVNPDDIALWNRKMERVVEPGEFRVMVGASSEDIKLTGSFFIQ